MPGGVLWTSLVSRGARVGREFFAEGGHVVANVDPTGAVLWARRVPGAHATAPLGVAAASDGSFALYGDGFLGRFAADGTPSWQLFDADVRGASFTKNSLVVIATAIGTHALGVTLAASGDQAVRRALIAFPR